MEKCKDDFVIIEGDCREEMRKLIEKGVQVDLTVTSPPYDNLRFYENSLNWNWDVFKDVAGLLYEITKEGGILVWVVNDATVNGSETLTSFKQALYFKEKCGFNLHDTMIYAKNSMTFPESNRYYPCFEYMFILSKGKPKTTNLIQDRKNKTAGSKFTITERQPDGTIKKVSDNRTGKITQEYGFRKNIWEYNTGHGKSSKNPIAFHHPAIFPLDLAMDHIRSWSNPRDVVLDCFMGSGTTGVACKQLNRRFIGIEKVKKYVDIAVERIDFCQTRLPF